MRRCDCVRWKCLSFASLTIWVSAGVGEEEAPDAGTVSGGDVGEGAVGAEAAAPVGEGGGVPVEERMGEGGCGAPDVVLDVAHYQHFVDRAGMDGLLSEKLFDMGYIVYFGDGERHDGMSVGEDA